jgi:LCP family protein required for cell wall assembly
VYEQSPQRRTRRLPGALVVVAVVAIAGTIGTLTAARSAIESVERVSDVADRLDPANSSVENFLLVGSDSRADVDPTAPDAGGIGTEADVTGTRSDTIMVLRRDRATGAASLLSIPRDLWVEIPGMGENRINAAFNDGPSTLVATVQESLGIPVHHYVEVDFSGFKALVEAIDGVEICFAYPTRDLKTGLNIEQPGCYVLDGVQALAYARSRAYEEFRDGEWRIDGTADLGRTKRQQAFVDEAMREALDRVIADPFAAGEFLDSGSGALRVDDELDVLAAAASLRVAVGDGLEPWSLPVYGDTIDGKSVLLLADGADELLAYFRGDAPAPVRPA